jgi:hypothetical protein
MFRLRVTSVGMIASLAAGCPAVAQSTPDEYATPAHVSAVQGRATVERDGRAEALTENLPLLVGDRLRTESGRLEVVLPDGSAIALDENSAVDLLSGGLMRLLGGRVVLVVARPPDGEARRDYQVDARAGMVRFLTSGEYRVSIVETGGAAGVEVAVVRGQAALDAEGASMRVSAGEGQGLASPTTFNSALADAFYLWADRLRSERVGAQSNAYLPADLQAYGGTFDREGSWASEPDYGEVWYPRVAADWRPYYDGTWYPYGWGWTWVGGGRWAWPTHHYGRWGYGARGWFWIPGAAWGPGWVSWGIAADYVAWCPLGWNDGPVFGLSFGFSTGWHSDPWRGWTVAPHHALARGGRVPSYALHGDHLRSIEPSQFAVRRAGPAGAATATDRAASQPFASSYGRAQAASGARGRAQYDRAPMAGRASQSFASPSQAPSPYPDRFRAPAGSEQREPGSTAAPRSPTYRIYGAGPATPSRPLPEAPSRSYSAPGAAGGRQPASRSFAAPGGSEQREPSSAAAPRSPAYRIYGEGPATPSRSLPEAPPRTYSARDSSGGAQPASRPFAAPDAVGGRQPAPRSVAAPDSVGGRQSAPRSVAAPDSVGGRQSSARSYAAPGTGGGRPSGPPASAGRGTSPGGGTASGGRGGSAAGSSSRGSSGGGRVSGGGGSSGGGGRRR